MSTQAKGILFLILSALCFSVGGLCIKFTSWEPMAINGGRAAIALMVLSLYLLIQRRKLVLNKYVFLGAFCLFLTGTLFIFSNKLTTAANAIVLQYTAPIFLIFILWIFFKKKPSTIDIAACITVFAGILCFFLDGLTTGGMMGNIIAVLAGISYAGVYLINSFEKGDALSSIYFGIILCFLAGFPFIFQETDVSLSAVTPIIVMGLFQQGFGYIFFYKGIITTPPVTACIILGIEPILSPLWVRIFYGETLSLLALLGCVIVISSILVYNIKKAA